MNKHINSSQQPDDFTRIRLPKKSENEILGIIESLLGANKLRVRCMDGVVRLTRIPGKMRRVRVHDGDVIIVIPWSFQNEKADIIWRYSPPHVSWLERKGFLKS